MDQEIIDNYYSQIGSSFYNSTEFYELKADNNISFIPNARFGIGILSCFMVADTLIVDTRRLYGAHDSSEPLKIIVQGHDSIFWISKGDRNIPGTTTELILRETNPWTILSDEKLVEHIESTVPNPSINIEIKTKSKNISHNESYFRNLDPSALKDHSWVQHDNIREFNLNLSKSILGIDGKALIGILEKDDLPVEKIEVLSKDVIIDGKSYELGMTIKMTTNEIAKTSDSIGVDDDGDIIEEDSYQWLAKSKSKLSLYGIEIPMSLFPTLWGTKQNVQLKWPFPMIIVLDIAEPTELELNSARTEIIYNEQWIEFEENLAYVICSELSKNVQKNYWNKLKELFQDKMKDTPFIRGLGRV
jgi:molecular chaperone HtpG